MNELGWVSEGCQKRAFSVLRGARIGRVAASGRMVGPQARGPRTPLGANCVEARHKSPPRPHWYAPLRAGRAGSRRAR